MTTPQVNGGVKFVSDHNPIPSMFTRFLAALAQIGKGQFATVSPSTGYASLADGTVPNQIAAGLGDVSELSDTHANAGQAAARLTDRFAYGLPASTTANDSFTDADFGVPFYIADENTPGKLSNSGGSNRSLGGLVFGLFPDGAGTPLLWTGPLAHLLARATLMTQAKVGAWATLADAAANTATAEVGIHREKLHGVVTAVEFTGDGVVADNTDYVTVVIAKRDGAGGAATTIATYDSRAANQGAVTASVPKAFGLSAVAGALNLLETDIVTITVTKGGAGKALRGAIRVVQKAI